MSYRCPHGRIVECLEDCPECRASWDIRDVAHYTARTAEAQSRLAAATEIEARERTRQRQSAEVTQSEIIEVGSQQRAVLAEQRYEMADTAGAIQLITEAIQRRGDFASFYIQRSRYYASQGQTELATRDLETAFNLNPEVLLDLERRLETHTLEEYGAMLQGLSAAIDEARGAVAGNCRARLSDASELLRDAKGGTAAAFREEELVRLDSVLKEAVAHLEGGSTHRVLHAARLSTRLLDEIPALVREAQAAAEKERRSNAESERRRLEAERSSVLEEFHRFESKLNAELSVVAEQYRDQLESLEEQEAEYRALENRMSRVPGPAPIAYIPTGVFALVGLLFGPGSVVFYVLISPLAVVVAFEVTPRVRRSVALSRLAAARGKSAALRQAKEAATARRRNEVAEALGAEALLQTTRDLDKRIVQLGGASSDVRFDTGRPN